MTERALRTVAFGDLEGGVWGAAVAVDGCPPVIIAGASGRTAALPADLSDGEPWRLTAEAVELEVTPVNPPVEATGTDRGRGGFDQLCRVTGQLSLGGDSQPVSSLGIRGARDGSLGGRGDGFAALREVAAWFEPDDGLALAAFRPGDAKGQDRDVISAAVLDSEHASPVEDPRLSTTYAADGWATRAGLELWLGGDEDQQLLRRAVGRALGPRATATPSAGLTIRAELFHFQSRGRDGAGVYLLVGAE